MDPATIATLSEILSKGGNVALFVAVYVAWKAGGVAREAVQALKELRDAAVSTKPVVEKIADVVDDIDRRTLNVERTGEMVHMKVSAALATTQKGV